MYKSNRITVVIPCLNEELGLRQVLTELPDFVDEVIVVDNNSTDRTAEVAQSMGAIVVRELYRVMAGLTRKASLTRPAISS